LFRNDAVASIVENAIFHYRDQGNYLIHRYVVMPDHLHLILTPGNSTTLEKSVQFIKGGSSREIGKRPGMRFAVWHPGFAEHQIRDQRDFDSHVRYSDENPLKRGASTTPEEYPHCSAGGRFALDPWPVASGAEAPQQASSVAAWLKPRPSDSTSESGGEKASSAIASQQASPAAAVLKPRPSESK
jgi:putative transposase